VVRNDYTYKIMPEKMKPLAKGIRPLFKQVEKELTGEPVSKRAEPVD
jgi:hypothetical protein